MKRRKFLSTSNAYDRVVKLVYDDQEFIIPLGRLHEFTVRRLGDSFTICLRAAGRQQDFVEYEL